MQEQCRVQGREAWWTPSRLARYQTATTIGIGYRFVEQNVNRLNPSSPEALLLGLDDELDALDSLPQVGVGLAHCLDHAGNEGMHEGLLLAEQVAFEKCAPE